MLLVPRLADSLAGRMEILRLHPLSQAELAGEDCSFLSKLFKASFRAGSSGRRLGMVLAERVVAGGYPSALTRATPRRRMAWYRDYADTLIQRDIRDLARDVVLESGGRVVGVEVKAASTVTNDDFKGLRKLQDAVQERFAAGVVLYDGGSVVPFGSNLYAVPISCLWQTN